VAEGEGRDAIAKRVNDVFDRADMVRAKRIAQTEVVGAYNEAAHAYAAQLPRDVVGTRRWLAHKDDRTRPTHRIADGQEQPIGAPFYVGGYPMMYPGDKAAPPDEWVNCRCSVAYMPPGLSYGGIAAAAQAYVDGLKAKPPPPVSPYDTSGVRDEHFGEVFYRDWATWDAEHPDIGRKPDADNDSDLANAQYHANMAGHAAMQHRLQSTAVVHGTETMKGTIVKTKEDIEAGSQGSSPEAYEIGKHAVAASQALQAAKDHAFEAERIAARNPGNQRIADAAKTARTHASAASARDATYHSKMSKHYGAAVLASHHAPGSTFEAGQQYLEHLPGGWTF
jgi:hypothetical protein